MFDTLVYFFWATPPIADYASPKVIGLFLLAFLLIAGSYYLSYRMRKQEQAVLRKFGKSWSSAMFWFGIVALVLLLSRTEGISFLSMRFFWVLWVLAVIAYAYLQYRLFTRRYHVIVPSQVVEDPRDAYLPKKGKKKQR